MLMTIDIPEKAVAEAESRGIAVEALIREKFEATHFPPGFVQLGSPTMSPAEATARIRELQQRYTLGGITIKELIEEGRRH
jgi:hypothetical protein